MTPPVGKDVERQYWTDRIRELNPESEYHEIYRITAAIEFPWDFSQSLLVATFRTFAVPSIGGLLHDTGEALTRTQKRMDDTTLLLDAVLQHGFDAGPGRDALRRINQMHGRYPISNDDFLYVLSTFVVVPIRWVQHHGWRPLLDEEVRASVNYYRELGRHMGIRDIPCSYREFAHLMDEYEVAHFAVDPKTRPIADALLDFVASHSGTGHLSRRLSRSFTLACMDRPLLDAFGLRRPSPPTRLLAQLALRLRQRLVSRMEPRREPLFASDMPSVISYPGGYQISELGTFHDEQGWEDDNVIPLSRSHARNTQ